MTKPKTEIVGRKSRPKITIEVCERLMDSPNYHAQLKAGKVWGCGKSKAEAIGDLIIHNPELFGVVVTDLGKQPR